MFTTTCCGFVPRSANKTSEPVRCLAWSGSFGQSRTLTACSNAGRPPVPTSDRSVSEGDAEPFGDESEEDGMWTEAHRARHRAGPEGAGGGICTVEEVAAWFPSGPTRRGAGGRPRPGGWSARSPGTCGWAVPGAQERGPEGLGLRRAEVQADNLAPALRVRPRPRLSPATGHDPAALPDLLVGHIPHREVRPLPLQRAGKEGVDALVDVLGTALRKGPLLLLDYAEKPP